MGHSDIEVTLNTYKHLGLEDAENELKGWRTCKMPEKNWSGRKEWPVSQKMFKAI